MYSVCKGVKCECMAYWKADMVYMEKRKLLVSALADCFGTMQLGQSNGRWADHSCTWGVLQTLTANWEGAGILTFMQRSSSLATVW
jgi:hypothetical protein